MYKRQNQYTLLDESKSELNTLIDLMTKNPNLTIEIGGHTDNTGIEKENQELSQKRAEAVVEFLVANGIAKERLVAKGYAASRPVADNKTEAGKALNRRTEFKVLSF